METILTNSPAAAAEFIKNGGIVAFPTETVYGLGASIFDPAAIERIFAAKRRPVDNPLIAHVGSASQIRILTAEVTAIAEKFINSFFPGPLTIVLRKADRVPMAATAGLDTIGIRMPRCDVAHKFLHACGVPVVAPSANVSGRPSPTTWEAVLEDLDGWIDCILKGEATEIGLESTVVDCTGDIPLVLRAGAISLEELQAVVPETIIDSGDAEERPKSPGMRHRHYAPRARVVLISEDIDPFLINEGSFGLSAYIGLTNPRRHFKKERVCDSVEKYAHEVFEFFRECDRLNIEAIYCETVPEAGIGIALMDRLRRAAER